MIKINIANISFGTTVACGDFPDIWTNNGQKYFLSSKVFYYYWFLHYRSFKDFTVTSKRQYFKPLLYQKKK